MSDRPGRRPSPPKRDGVCLSCKYAKNRFRESSFCVLYGYIIGYPKIDCRGYKRDKVQEPENNG